MQLNDDLIQFRGNPITDEQREVAEKTRVERGLEIDELRERAKL